MPALQMLRQTSVNALWHSLQLYARQYSLFPKDITLLLCKVPHISGKIPLFLSVFHYDCPSTKPRMKKFQVATQISCSLCSCEEAIAAQWLPSQLIQTKLLGSYNLF